MWTNAAMVVLPGLAALAILAARGALSPRAFAAAPPRRVRLGFLDLLIGVALMILGGMLARALLAWLAPSLLPAAGPETLAPLDRTRRLLVVQFCSQGIVLPWLIVRAAAEPGGFRELGLIPRHPFAEARSALLALLAALPLVNLASSVMQVIGRAIGHPAPAIDHELLMLLRDSPTPGVIAMLAVSAAVVAPLFEEVIFRGLLQGVLVTLLGTNHRWRAVLLAAALFAAIHIPEVTWHALPSLFILGIIFGWLYERTGSLLPGVLVHAGFNAINLVLALHAASPPPI
jgi:membrane protease YdiL (CAAX protease family)